MLKWVQHDKRKYVIPNLFRNLEFGNDDKLIAPVSDRLKLPSLSLSLHLSRNLQIHLERVFLIFLKSQWPPF